jgi:VanZ family protein
MSTMATPRAASISQNLPVRMPEPALTVLDTHNPLCYALYAMVNAKPARHANKSASSVRTRDIVVLWGPVFVWMAIIFYLSSVNTWTVGDGPPAYHALRKVGHVFEYSVLALLLGRALAGMIERRGAALGRPAMLKVWWAGVSLATLYAVTDELHQAFVPRREFHLTDILIDALSATAALGIWYIWRIRTGRSSLSGGHNLRGLKFK